MIFVDNKNVGEEAIISKLGTESPLAWTYAHVRSEETIFEMKK